MHWVFDLVTMCWIFLVGLLKWRSVLCFWVLVTVICAECLLCFRFFCGLQRRICCFITGFPFALLAC